MAEIGRRVGPAAGPARTDEHPRARLDPAMLRLERQHVRRRHAVVAVRSGLVADVDDDDGPDQALERHALHRLAVAREVDRRVKMRAAVLRRAERVGGIEEPAGVSPKCSCLSSKCAGGDGQNTVFELYACVRSTRR